jgi:hypothetical protein
MSDEQQEQEQTVTETPVENTETPVVETPETPVAEEPGAAGLAMAEAEAGAAAAEEKPEGEEPPAFTPNLKFKAGVYNKESRELEQKEYEIDKKFAPLMATPEGEKLVKELHEKAYGLDSVKERYTEVKNQNMQLHKENVDIKGSVDGLRKVYQSATGPGGNIHKLDGFFAKLRIPPDVIMQYAVAKAELAEMDPAQRNAIQGQLRAESDAEALTEQQMNQQQQFVSQAQQIKNQQLELTLMRPEISTLAQEFDSRFAQPGAFEAEVRRVGEYEWLRSQGKVDLTPEQAVLKVIEHYALKTNPRVPAAAQPAAAAAPATTPGANKPVVQRTTKTIPNVSGRSTSPLAQKPKTVDDLKNIYQERYAQSN